MGFYLINKLLIPRSKNVKFHFRFYIFRIICFVSSYVSMRYHFMTQYLLGLHLMHIQISKSARQIQISKAALHCSCTFCPLIELICIVFIIFFSFEVIEFRSNIIVSKTEIKILRISLFLFAVTGK